MVGTTFDTATTSLVSKLITHSENEVNKYLSKRYDIGSFVSSVPPLVTSLTETLAEGYSYQRMSRGGKEAMARGSALIKQAQENLKMIAEFKADLLDSNGDTIAEASDASGLILCNTKDYNSTFDEDSEINWEVDPSKLDDISALRS